MNKEEKKLPRYQREQGNREARGAKQRLITFSFTKHLANQGQTFKDWEASGLSGALMERLKFVGQHTTAQALQNQYIKNYTKVDFPPDSEFKKPVHLANVTWAVMHVTNNSKEVVVGYIEEDVFYIIFLDKEHKFWPSNLKNT